MGHDTTIYDTTLRDGCQGAGISLALRDKLDIARKLDETGIDYVEGGWPGSNPKDAEFFAAIRQAPLRHARVSAFGSTRRPGVKADDDQNLRLLVAAETPTVALVAKAWDFHVRDVLHTTPEENLAMVADSVAFVKRHDREVVFDAEHFFDGFRANRDYALAVLGAAADAGADWLVLCDTNGGSLPDEVAGVVREVVAAFEPPVGIHAHNDGSLAVANSLAAVAAGATQVQGTVNGYGERVGNANLCSIIPNLVLKMGRRCAAGDGLRNLTNLSRYVDDVANVVSNPRLPFVGHSAFAHKGGIHVHAVASDPTTYEHVDPALVGNERHILVGELSGRSNVVERARELGFELDPRGTTAKVVADRIKALEHEGFQLEDAEASFELLIRRATREYRPPLEALTYRVESRKDGDAGASTSTAVVDVAVDGETLTGEATGGGPVDALEKAFRHALASAYPELELVVLTNFRAQIVGGRSGTRAPVRVRVTGSRPDGSSWTTVGCSSDLLHASWLALADCFEYAVATAAREPDRPRKATV
jgi:2-isopropylmalate synthase